MRDQNSSSSVFFALRGLCTSTVQASLAKGLDGERRSGIKKSGGDEEVDESVEGGDDDNAEDIAVDGDEDNSLGAPRG